MIALAMHEGSNRLIICNGYKDHDYIRLALLGRKLGKRVILVVEQLSEIDDIIRISAGDGGEADDRLPGQAPDPRRGPVGPVHGRQRQVRPQHGGDPLRLREAEGGQAEGLPAPLPLPHRLAGPQHHHDQERRDRGDALLLPAGQDGLPHGLHRRRRRPRDRLRRVAHELRELDELLDGGVRPRRRLQRAARSAARRASPSRTS